MVRFLYVKVLKVMNSCVGGGGINGRRGLHPHGTAHI